MPIKTITAKSVVKADIETIHTLCDRKDLSLLADWLDLHYLMHKVKFPVLEYLTGFFYEKLDESLLIDLLDELISRDRIGSYVFAGKALQLHYSSNQSLSLKKVKEYMVLGDKWYSCDIMGERVFGHAMLEDFDKVFPEMEKAVCDESIWVVRAVGTGMHYATKKGLHVSSVELLFDLLCRQKNRNEFHVKKGMGWAAKTICKFYPEMVRAKHGEWKDASPWFLSKLDKGFYLSAKYAGKYGED